MNLKSLILTGLLPVTLFLAGCDTATTDSNVSARQDIMKNWKDAKGILDNMVKQPESFDAVKFKEEANFLAEDSSKAWEHFKSKDKIGGSTPAVWSNPEGFAEAAEKYQQAAAKLAAVAQNATAAEQVQVPLAELGDSCKSCHKEFKAK